LVFTPLGNESLIFDIGVIGYTGKVKGIGADISGKYIF
jgi:hypothetical protein